MIIVRSPLRISLGGGGTDLPSYYQAHTGFVIAAAIDKYVYISLNDRFDRRISIRYSKMEVVDRIDEIEHPIVREAARSLGFEELHVDIASTADVPAGTGLGSSGSFTTALLRALHAYRREFVSPQRLARLACEIEIDRLGEPIGKQDQYIAACGGLTHFTFLPNGEVEVGRLNVPEDALAALEENLMLFFTGVTRSASQLLADQNTKTQGGDQTMLEMMHFTKQLGYESKEALERGDLLRFAELLNVHWQRKRARSDGMTNSDIDAWYDHALANGAIGGKLIGAGGGGFLMFYAADKERLRSAMRDAGLREMRFRFDFHGTRLIAES